MAIKHLAKKYYMCLNIIKEIYYEHIEKDDEIAEKFQNRN